MRGKAATMTVLRPQTPAEAFEAYSKTPAALPLAGGTDLMASWNMGLLNGKTVLDLSRLEAWRSIRVSPEAVRIGALATHAEIQAHPVIRRHFPLLVEACATIGAAQIQNRGTLGGNIANASPAGDTFPPLAVYEAAVCAASSEARRAVPLAEIFAGVKRTTLRPGELIWAVELPIPAAAPSRRMFRKVGTRLAQAISKAVAAGALWFDHGTVRELRFALGSVAPTVRRLKAVEEFVRGKRLSGPVIDEAVALLERDISPIDDVRSTRRYRLAVCRNLLRSFLAG